MSRIKLSLVIPMYNVENYIVECINSIKSQITEEVEVIIVDDGSTDNSKKVLDDIILNLPKIKSNQFKVLSQKNQGQSVARNTALDIAIGSYVAFVDSDDILPENYFKQVVEIIDTYQPDVICCEAERFLRKPNDTNFRIYLSDQEGYVENTQEVKQRIFNQHNWYPWLYIFKREVFADKRFIPGIYFEDIIFMTDVIIRARNLYFSKMVSYYYRSNAESSLRAVNLSNIKKQKLSYEFVINYSYEKILSNKLYAITYIYCLADYITDSVNKFNMKPLQVMKNYFPLRDFENRVDLNLIQRQGYHNFYHHGFIFIGWIWLHHKLKKQKMAN